jgi:hypothetical protein
VPANYLRASHGRLALERAHSALTAALRTCDGDQRVVIEQAIDEVGAAIDAIRHESPAKSPQELSLIAIKLVRHAETGGAGSPAQWSLFAGAVRNLQIVVESKQPEPPKVA